MKNDTTVGINKKLLKRLKFIALLTDKKLYETIEEAANILEDKYNIIRSTSEVELSHE